MPIWIGAARDKRSETQLRLSSGLQTVACSP